ncbi:MAG: hypothetical protein QW540_08060 [Archaeoglobaceae archaeon]
MVFEAISRPIAEALAPLFGKTVDEVQNYVEGILMLLVLIVGIFLGFKVIRYLR